MTPDSETSVLAQSVISALMAVQSRIVTAESCTGGLIAGALTSVSGASDAVYGGFVTYANEAKMAMIDVPEPLLRQHGAVSEPVARAMAEGAKAAAGVDYAVAVTGIAGPNGGTPDKPVGLVHFAVATPEGTLHSEKRFGDLGREEVRHATVRYALELVLGSIHDLT